MIELPPSIEVVLFDVFDTVVARNVYHPHDLYARVERRLTEEVGAAMGGFPLKRAAAEARARGRLTAREEVTFAEIGSELASWCGFTPRSVEAIAACEIEEELKSVVPVGLLLSLIGEIRQTGRTIAFVSDMYLPDDVIREMLQCAGVMESGDRVYVSGSIGKKKSTGSLFRHVLDDLGVRPDQVIHVGDYLLSDYLVPRWKHGIRSLPVRIARANGYERLWGDQSDHLCCSSISGASRAGRVAGKGSHSTDTALYTIGCNVVGPIITCFMIWALQQAVRDGIRRMYFLSRDGDIMLEVARELVGRLGIEIELRYLHVSRAAVFPALIATGVNARTIEWLKEYNIVLTPRIIADRLRVDTARLHERLIYAGIDLSGPDTALGREAVERICRSLTTDPILREMVTESGDNAFQALAGYMEQEGLFDGSPSALVDLGWHGSIQDVLYACFLNRFGDNGISGYYFGVDREGQTSNRKTGFFFGPSESSEIGRYQHLFRVLLEVVCSAYHGMVSHYHRNAQGRFEPIFGSLEHPLNGDRVGNIRHGVHSFLAYLDISDVGGAESDHLRPRILSVLKMLFFCPSRDEAIALGDFCFSADQAGHGVHQVAPPFTIGSLLCYLTRKSYAGRSTVSSWFFASWKRSGSVLRWLLLPLVLCLQAYHVGFELLTFMKIKIIDAVNTCINGIER